MKRFLVPMSLLVCLLLTGCGPKAPSNPGGGSSNNPDISNPDDGGTQPDSGDVPSQGAFTFNKPNPNAIPVSIEQLQNIGKSYSNNQGDGKLYRIKGTMQHVTNTKFGNAEITGDDGYSVMIYGLCRNSSCITGNQNNYHFSNDRSYHQTKIDGGDEVTLEGIFLTYSYSPRYKIVEFQGYPTECNLNTKGVSTVTSYKGKDPYVGTYYDSIGDEYGSQLGLKLHNLMIDTHKNYTGYSECLNKFRYTDDYGTGSARCLYTNKTGKLNGEHVWARSKTKQTQGDKKNLYEKDGGGGDMHHIRAADPDTNSVRSSTLYGNMFAKDKLRKIARNNVPGKGGTEYNYYAAGSTAGTFEPADSIKGDIARIIAYVYVHYSTNNYSGKTNQYTGDLYIDNIMAGGKTEAFRTLRNWNALDPVDKYEIDRNDYIYNIQKNRNPFIDHPSYMDKLFA